MNCKRDHIFDCVTGWRNRLFYSLKKHESPIWLLERVTFFEREKEREVELWDFFPNEKNKGRGVLCPEFSFLHFRCRERMRASTLWMWRCYSGDEAQAESTIIIQLSKWEERQELQASHYTEQQRAPSEMRCGYYTLLPPACQVTHLQILLDWPAAAITTLELDKPHSKSQVKGA